MELRRRTYAALALRGRAKYAALRAIVLDARALLSQIDPSDPSAGLASPEAQHVSGR